MQNKNSSPAIQTQSLRKEFGEKVAVADLSLTVARGEVFGFLGPNGAGKTTSVKMLLGLVAPTSGGGTILGERLGSPAGREKVGFLPEHFRFHGWLKGREFLKLHADLLGIPNKRQKQKIEDLLELVELSPHAEKKLQAYSKGMLQRIGLAQALLSDPELVILDEPTSGLDPFGRMLVRDIIKDLRDLGATVFLNSHLLSEIEVTCDRVAFIKNGEIVRTVDLRTSSADSIHVDIKAHNITESVVDGLREWASQVRANGETMSLVVPNEDLLPIINRYLVENKVDVFSLRPERTSLEDMFVEIMEGGR